MSRYLKSRRRKGMIFKPTGLIGSKRALTSQIVARRNDLVGWDGQNLGQGRIADKYYFRFYKHKGQGYALYLGPEKFTHGGLRHRTKSHRHPRTKRNSSYNRSQSLEEREDEQNELDQILKNYDRIDSGPHEGMYKHKESGKIISELQLRILLAQRKVE